MQQIEWREHKWSTYGRWTNQLPLSRHRWLVNVAGMIPLFVTFKTTTRSWLHWASAHISWTVIVNSKNLLMLFLVSVAISTCECSNSRGTLSLQLRWKAESLWFASQPAFHLKPPTVLTTELWIDSEVHNSYWMQSNSHSSPQSLFFPSFPWSHLCWSCYGTEMWEIIIAENEIQYQQ